MLHLVKFRNGARAPENVHNVEAQETVKHCAKFGWLPLSDVAAVTKPRPVEISWGAPNYRTDLNRLWAEVHHIVGTCGRDITA